MATHDVRTEWQGHYLSGRTAARQPALIRLFTSGLEVICEGQSLWWPYGEIRQTQGSYTGQQVRLQHGQEAPEAIQVSDPAFLTAMHRRAGLQGARFQRPIGHRRRALQALGAGLGLTTVIILWYLWGIPGVAAVVTPHIPVAWEERMGNTVLNHLVTQRPRCIDPARLQVIEDIMTTLSSSIQNSPYAFRLVVLDDAQVNAFALPGGYIVLFRGLIAQSDSAEEVAGVLAHEMQHIVLRHSTRALLQHASMGVLLAALSGDSRGASPSVFELTRLLGTLRYSRRHEAEADAAGLRLLIAAGIDPRGMLRFLQKLQRQELQTPAFFTYLSTHPSLDDRLARLTDLARSAPPDIEKLFEHLRWEDMRQICRAAR
jgi:Zn-dependent protease with chaperone function